MNAARLYELVVRSWLNRDEGKHQFNESHKRRLMEELAAALWRDGSKQWEVERLEAWLDEYLAANPTLTSAYANKDRNVLKEDLRTATFVLRPTTEEKHFRFAHTSLQEYFLAAYLARALIEEKASCGTSRGCPGRRWISSARSWTPRPSPWPCARWRRFWVAKPCAPPCSRSPTGYVPMSRGSRCPIPRA